jgi:hypothetical protein
MDSELRTLIDQMVDGAITEWKRERTFGRLLQDVRDDEHGELAAYIHHHFAIHRELPSDVTVRLEVVEQYLAERLRIADWPF